MLAAPLPLALAVPTLTAISAVLLLAGAGFGLPTVAVFELLVDAARAVEAFTWLTTAQGAG